MGSPLTASSVRRAKSSSRGPAGAAPKVEHLIALKVHAIKNYPTRRLKDLADIDYLLGQPGTDRVEVERPSKVASLDDDLDLDADLPVTVADVAALRAHRPSAMMFSEWFDYLRTFEPANTEILRHRKGPSGPPFELPPDGP